MRSCRSTFVVARLKELHHEEGLDVVMIHPPASLRSVIAHAQWPANHIGLWGIGAIEKNGAHFDNVRRFRSLAREASRVCLVISEEDKTISPQSAKDLAETCCSGISSQRYFKLLSALGHSCTSSKMMSVLPSWISASISIERALRMVAGSKLASNRRARRGFFSKFR